MSTLAEPAIAYRPREAAQLLGLGRSRIYELIASGEIRARKLGSATLIERIELGCGRPQGLTQAEPSGKASRAGG